MEKVLVTLRLDPKKASLVEVERLLDLAPGELDEEYGVVLIDPEKHLYVILAEERAAARIEGARPVRGVHSNPRIEPFGPPET